MMNRSISQTMLLATTCALLSSCAPEIIETPALQMVTVVPNNLRPSVMGLNGGVSAGHPLTSSAALEILQGGGNAFDAGVAALLVGGVVEQDLYSLGGEALVLVYPQSERRVTSIAGQGWAAQGASIDWYLERNKNLNGYGLDPTVVPGALHGALTVLERWGTMSLEEVSARAIEYAEFGFPLRSRTAQAIRREREFIDQWPDNRRYWYRPDGTMYLPGEIIRLPTLADTLKKMVEAEREAMPQGREAAIVAARDRFYKGDIAQEMVSFLQEHGTPFDEEDFSEFYARIEEPTSTTYRGYTIYKQSFNSQGPLLLQTLNILENFDLRGMGHNSSDYLHTIVEAFKLAYADRDSFYADPDFVTIPEDGLLSKEYAAQRAQLIDMEHASETFVAGNPFIFDDAFESETDWEYWMADFGESVEPLLATVDHPGSEKDTTHIAIIDKDGNVFDSTPSGGWIGGSVILGNTGIAMSVRGEQFWLDETRAAQLRPRSRPRYTLTPSIVLRNGEPFLAIGSPGGDNQEQTILQTFLNIVEFQSNWYPNLHQALQAARVQTLHFRASFWPHESGFNRLNVENNIPPEVILSLESRGHIVNRVPPLAIPGCATTVMINPNNDARIAGADARRDCYAIAY
jgi:gamma-glutamyltranspeptidase/glutathione hydrolase